MSAYGTQYNCNDDWVCYTNLSLRIREGQTSSEEAVLGTTSLLADGFPPPPAPPHPPPPHPHPHHPALELPHHVIKNIHFSVSSLAHKALKNRAEAKHFLPSVFLSNVPNNPQQTQHRPTVGSSLDVPYPKCLGVKRASELKNDVTYTY